MKKKILVTVIVVIAVIIGVIAYNASAGHTKAGGVVVEEVTPEPSADTCECDTRYESPLVVD